MTQEQAIGIAMGVSAAVFILSLIFSSKLIDLSWRTRFRERAKAAGCVTTGYFVKRRVRTRVDDKNGYDNFDYRVTIKYKYTVDCSEYYTKVKYRHENVNKGDYYGDPLQVTVYYDEKNPKKGYAESRVSDRAAREDGVILTWLMTLAAGFITYFLLSAIFM